MNNEVKRNSEHIKSKKDQLPLLLQQLDRAKKLSEPKRLYIKHTKQQTLNQTKLSTMHNAYSTQYNRCNISNKQHPYNTKELTFLSNICKY